MGSDWITVLPRERVAYEQSGWIYSHIVKITPHRFSGQKLHHGVEPCVIMHRRRTKEFLDGR